MATITIEKPFEVEVRGEGYFDALPADDDGRILAKESQIVKFEYHVGGNTYTLPTSGSATSRAGASAADLSALSDTDTDDPPPEPFVINFNTGTLYKVTVGGGHKLELRDVDADLAVTGASSSTTYDSGGTVLLDAGGSGYPTHKKP